MSNLYTFPTQCETGEACGVALGANSSFAQGKQFLEMNSKFHGGRRTRRMRGGAVAELASFPNSFTPSILPEDLHATAGVAPLDKAIADLAQFRQTGGRRTRRYRRSGGAFGASASPVNAPGMLLTPAEEGKAFLNPQWYNENVVNPNFQGPATPKVGGRRRKHRSRKHRKGSRKHRKGSRKHRKGSRKHRKGSRRH